MRIPFFVKFSVFLAVVAVGLNIYTAVHHQFEEIDSSQYENVYRWNKEVPAMKNDKITRRDYLTLEEMYREIKREEIKNRILPGYHHAI